MSLPQPKKRGPIAKACLACFTQKKKCDKNQPSCQTCLNRGQVCHYPHQLQSNLIKSLPIPMANRSIASIIPDKGHMKYAVFRYEIANKSHKKKTKDKSDVIMSLFHPNKAIASIKLMLKNSILDIHEALLLTSIDGRIDYCGRSPFSYLFTIHYNLDGKQLPQLHNQMASPLPTQPIFDTDFYLQLRIQSKSIINDCIDSFFDRFNLYFKILDRDYFDSNDSELLNLVVCAIGCRYLPNGEPIPYLSNWFDHLAFNQFGKTYHQPNLALIITLLLIGQYQIMTSHQPSACYFQAYANCMTRNLGLHLNVPKHLNLNQTQLKARKLAYWGCYNLDKLLAFSLNRQIMVQMDHANIPYLSPSDNEVLIISPISNSTDKTLMECYLSDIYWYHFSILCTIMSKSMGLLRFNFKMEPIKSPDLCKQLLLELTRWQTNYTQHLRLKTHNLPEWIQPLVKHYFYHLTIIAYSIAIQLCHPFHIHQSIDIRSQFINLSHHYATSTLIHAENLGSSFFRSGILYRLYSVFSAVIEIAHLTTSNDRNQANKAKLFIKRGVELVDQTRQYFPVANECYDMILAYID